MLEDNRERRIAVLDLGSQTFRLAIIRCNGTGIETMTSRMANVRLGSGLSKEPILQPDAMQRGIETLKRFKEIMDEYNVDKIYASATAALRTAVNADRFIQIAKKEGIEIEVIPAEREAAIAALGVMHTLPGMDADTGIIDVGGGSTEFILTRKGGDPIRHSIGLGAVNVTESFLRHDPPLPSELLDMEAHINSALSSLIHEVGHRPILLVGIGGTATTLAAMSIGMKEYDPRRIRGLKLSLDEITHWIDRLKKMTIKQKSDIPGLQPARADIILAGAWIIRTFMHMQGFPVITICDGGLLTGLLIRAIEKEYCNNAEPSSTRSIYL